MSGAGRRKAATCSARPIVVNETDPNMTIKLLVLSTAPNTNRILDVMKSEAAGALDVVLHFGDKTADFKASSLSRMTNARGTQGHLMDEGIYSGTAQGLIRSDAYFPMRDLFWEHLNRTADSAKYKSHPLKTPHDYVDYYHIVADSMAEKIRASGATHCLFFNIPHLAYDTLIHQIVTQMGLPTTIVTQSLFPAKFFSMVDPGAYGDFRPDPAAPPFVIERGSKPDLFYMKGIKQEREQGGRVTARAMLQLATFLATKRPLSAFNPVYLAKTLRHMQKVYGAFPKWRDPFARFFHEDELAYFDHLATYEDGPVDLSGDYVYFPLQLQPEMTTSSLGGRFRDQAYAIECLSELLPPHVRILVKENPKQGGYQRGPLFFHRLKRLPNVTFLPSWADTHALTDGAKFVAAITGTAGWEAIRSGKPALAFGNAWYRKLPGVVEYTPELTYEAIISTEIDHNQLERAVGGLLAHSHDGVVDRHYTKIAPDFDVNSNDRTAARTILSLLRGTTTPTFGTKPT